MTKTSVLCVARRVVYGTSLGLYGLGLMLMVVVGFQTRAWSFHSDFGGEGSWQIEVENSPLFATAAVLLPVLFFALQLVPWGWAVTGQLKGAARIWGSVVKTQAALGIGALTLWIALNTQDLGEGLVHHSSVFSLGAVLAAGSLGAIIAPVLQQVAEGETDR